MGGSRDGSADILAPGEGVEQNCCQKGAISSCMYKIICGITCMTADRPSPGAVEC